MTSDEHPETRLRTFYWKRRRALAPRPDIERYFGSRPITARPLVLAEVGHTDGLLLATVNEHGRPANRVGQPRFS